MKTILIPIFQGSSAFHILRTDVFRLLQKEEGVRIVLLISGKERMEFYKKSFPESVRLGYEEFHGFDHSVFESIFSKLKVYLLRTATMDVKRRYGLYESKNYLRFWLSFIVNRIVARKSVRALVRIFDLYFVPGSKLASIFNRYTVDLLFLPHPFGDDETALLREAKKHGIPTVGFVNSWDKLTSRSILRILPDHLIVPNEITKKEAQKYHDMEASKISVTGAPQFDWYKKLSPTPRTEFFSKLGIPEDKRLVLFCPTGKSFSDSDSKYMELLEKLLKEGEIPHDLHFLVRFPPNDNVELSQNLDSKLFTFSRPGVRFSKERGVDWDMNEADVQSLTDALTYSELVICPPSTISIDAAIFDKPVINLGFDFVPDNSYRSMLRFYKSSHYMNVLKTGGIYLAKNADDLAKAVNGYLSRKETDSKGRERIVEEQVGVNDGKAGERIAKLILKVL